MATVLLSIILRPSVRASVTSCNQDYDTTLTMEIAGNAPSCHVQLYLDVPNWRVAYIYSEQPAAAAY